MRGRACAFWTPRQRRQSACFEPAVQRFSAGVSDRFRIARICMANRKSPAAYRFTEAGDDSEASLIRHLPIGTRRAGDRPQPVGTDGRLVCVYGHGAIGAGTNMKFWVRYSCYIYDLYDTR